MRELSRAAVAFLREERGQSAVEYAAMLSWIALTCMTVVQTLSGKANTTFNTVGSQLGRSAGS